MHERHVADGLIPGKRLSNQYGRGRLVLGTLQHSVPAADDLADARDAFAVLTVDAHENVTVAWNQRSERRLDRKRPAALHEHAGMIVAAMRYVVQWRHERGCHVNKSDVARAVVTRVCFLGPQRRSERSGRQ